MFFKDTLRDMIFQSYLAENSILALDLVDSVENLLVPLLYPDGVRADDNRGLPFTLTQVLHLIKFSLGICS